MEALPLIILFFGHFVSDGIFQDEKWAVNKSKDQLALLKHTITYSIVMFIFAMTVLPTMSAIGFGVITFITHTVTDYFTSKIVAKKFANNHLGSSIPNLGAFTWILFDQWLHTTQIILTYLALS